MSVNRAIAEPTHGVQGQINRLISAKQSLKTAITNKGITVPDSVKMDGLYAYVNSIGVGIPIEISTDADMEAVLTSDNVGKVYKFTGTSDTYITGDLYIVEVG